LLSVVVAAAAVCVFARMYVVVVDDGDDAAVAAAIVVVFCCCYFFRVGLVETERPKTNADTCSLSLSLEYYSGMFYLLPAVLPSRFLPSWFQYHYSSECFKHIKWYKILFKVI